MCVMQMSVLRTDRRVIQTRGDGMRRSDLTVCILQQITLRSLQHTDGSAIHEPRRMIAELISTTARLDADHSYFVIEKLMEEPDCVGAATHACDESVRQTSFSG